jgi:hypothetical protein
MYSYILTDVTHNYYTRYNVKQVRSFLWTALSSYRELKCSFIHVGKRWILVNLRLRLHYPPKKPPIFIECEAVRLHRREELIFPTGNRTTDRSTCSVLTIPIDLRKLISNKLAY